MAKGDDTRYRKQVAHQQNRYENQQGPLANTMAYNYGRGSEADYGNYTDIMNRYRDIAGGGGAGGSVQGYGPSHISYNDPFNSYKGFQEFSTTGGYSPQDIANMRARGVSPIRAAYGNAERELQRGRSLQGGYSPNMAAAQVKMAREQGQGMADATQNVEAGLAEARNKGRLAGLQGMYGVEGQRLGADLDVSKFNAQANMAAGASGASASAQNAENQMAALRGMTSLYGTTPGMSNMFGNQVSNIVGQGGTFGLNLAGRMGEAANMPNTFDTTMNRVGGIANMAYPWLDYLENRKKKPGTGTNPASGYPE